MPRQKTKTRPKAKRRSNPKPRRRGKSPSKAPLLAGSKIVFRANPSAAACLPTGVRSTGVHILGGQGRENRAKRVSILLWCSEGEGKVWLSGRAYPLTAGFVAVCLPEDVHHWESSSDFWRLRWFTWDGPVAEAIVKGFGMPRHPFKAGQCPEALFDQLFHLVGQQHPQAEALASVYAYHILAHAASHLGEPEADRLPQRAKDILDARFSDPSFGIDQLASELHVHRSTLTRSFTKYYRLPPGTYLVQSRMQAALGLLLGTNLPVADVAQQAGFRDAGYFSRVVHEFYGDSPLKLRQRGF
jgi:AraC-like DNA-binding protein